MKIPTIREVQAYANELARVHGGKPFDAREFIRHYQAQGWLRADGIEMTRWQSAAVWWARNGKPHPYVEEEEPEDYGRKWRFYAGALWLQVNLDYKPGWVFHNYRERWGENPPRSWAWEVSPHPPLEEDFLWMQWKYQNYKKQEMRQLEDEKPIPNNVVQFRRKA